MVIGKIKPVATIVAQFAAGVEVDAIQHEGKMFLPVVNMGEFETTSGDDAPKETKADKDASPKKEKSSAKKYTEKEMMDMSSKDLAKILKEEFGVDPDDFDGKNTNKKLRDLILDAQDGNLDNDSDEDDEEETEKDAKPEKKAESDKGKKDDAEDEDEEEDDEPGDDFNQICGILEDFDAGKKNKKKTISALCELNDNADESAVTKLVETFEEDSDADLEEIADQIEKALKGKVSEKKTKKSSKKDDKLVEPEDLEVGDRVSVWWDDDNQEWADGEVKSIKKGKITIAYDDDTEDVLDPEVHTKIKLLTK